MIHKKVLHFRTEYSCCVNFEDTLHVLPTARVGFTRCGAKTRDHRREATAAAAGVVVRCWCCCGLGTRTHTKPVPVTSGWTVYTYIRRGTRRQSSDSEKHNDPHTTAGKHRHTSKVLCRALRRRLSERPSFKSGLSVSRAPPLGAFVSRLGKRRDQSDRHRQSPTFVPTKFLQNSWFIGRAWPNFPAFYIAFRKNPSTKVFLRYRWCAPLCAV